MRSDEIRDSGHVVGTALDEVAVLVRDVHGAVSQRIFGALGAAGRPARLMHDGVSAIAYTSTRVGVRWLPPVVGLGVAVRRDAAAPSAHDVPAGRVALGALNGFWGDRFEQQRPAIATPLRIRTHDGPMRAVTDNLIHDARADATGRLVIFLHGLCESDVSWWLGSERAWGARNTTYGSKLRADDGWTPLYVQLNTGRHISENGHDLAVRIEEIVAAWPVPVREIAIVGHSMGGLIARSATHQAADLGHRWVRALGHVVGLGAPHTGAPLERIVARGTHAMSRLPETRPFATWLNRRSVGIKDLRHGAILDADWFGVDYDVCLDDRCTAVELLPGVAYSMASATLSRRPEGWFAHDLLVEHRSANGIGSTRTLGFDPERSLHIGGKHHFHLLNDGRLYAALRRWLATPLTAGAAVNA